MNLSLMSFLRLNFTNLWAYCSSTAARWSARFYAAAAKASANATALIVWLLFIGHPRILETTGHSYNPMSINYNFSKTLLRSFNFGNHKFRVIYVPIFKIIRLLFPLLDDNKTKCKKSTQKSYPYVKISVPLIFQFLNFSAKKSRTSTTFCMTLKDVKKNDLW